MTWSQMSAIQKVFCVTVLALLIAGANYVCFHHPSTMSIIAGCSLNALFLGVAFHVRRKGLA